MFQYINKCIKIYCPLMSVRGKPINFSNMILSANYR